MDGHTHHDTMNPFFRLTSMALAPSASCAPTHAMLAATTTSPQLPASSSSSRPRVSTLQYLQQPTSYLYGNNHGHGRARSADLIRCRRRLLTARGERPSHEDEEDDEVAGFDAAVALFNRGEYHACHDVVEELWYAAEDPTRTLLHGLLQCAVGFHHLFNQNHRGAMMELGEGLCKLRKLNLDHDDNPFSLFRDDVSSVLQFLYRTQKELAACTDDMCLTMNGSPTSYQLLGDFAAGRQLYRLKAADTGDGVSMSIIFSMSDDDRASEPAAPHTVVKLPTLHATEQNLTDLQRAYEFM